jgi:hypothetical protein
MGHNKKKAIKEIGKAVSALSKLKLTKAAEKRLTSAHKRKKRKKK